MTPLTLGFAIGALYDPEQQLKEREAVLYGECRVDEVVAQWYNPIIIYYLFVMTPKNPNIPSTMVSFEQLSPGTPARILYDLLSKRGYELESSGLLADIAALTDLIQEEIEFAPEQPNTTVEMREFSKQDGISEGALYVFTQGFYDQNKGSRVAILKTTLDAVANTGENDMSTGVPISVRVGKANVQIVAVDINKGQKLAYALISRDIGYDGGKNIVPEHFLLPLPKNKVPAIMDGIITSGRRLATRDDVQVKLEFREEGPYIIVEEMMMGAPLELDPMAGQLAHTVQAIKPDVSLWKEIVAGVTNDKINLVNPGQRLLGQYSGLKQNLEQVKLWITDPMMDRSSKGASRRFVLFRKR